MTLGQADPGQNYSAALGAKKADLARSEGTVISDPADLMPYGLQKRGFSVAEPCICSIA